MKTLEIRERDSYALANQIDRLAYLFDEYEYFDAVGRGEEDFQANVDRIAADLIVGKVNDYGNWLWDRSEDATLSEKDRERARAVLTRLIDYATSF